MDREEQFGRALPRQVRFEIDAEDADRGESPLRMATPMAPLISGGKDREALMPVVEDEEMQEPEERTAEKTEGRRRAQKEREGLSHEVVAGDEGEEGEEGRPARMGTAPYNPSRAEREQHELTHTPYR